MTEPRDTAAFARLAQKIAPGSTLLRAWALHGGISARVTALDIKHGDGQTQTLIVRQHGAVDLARNPNIAADEFALLRVLHDAGLPTPTPYFSTSQANCLPRPLSLSNISRANRSSRSTRRRSHAPVCRATCADSPGGLCRGHARISATAERPCDREDQQPSRDARRLARLRDASALRWRRRGPGRSRIVRACCMVTIGPATSYGGRGGSSASSIGRMRREAIRSPISPTVGSKSSGRLAATPCTFHRRVCGAGAHRWFAICPTGISMRRCDISPTFAPSPPMTQPPRRNCASDTACSSRRRSSGFLPGKQPTRWR